VIEKSSDWYNMYGDPVLVMITGQWTQEKIRRVMNDPDSDIVVIHKLEGAAVSINPTPPESFPDRYAILIYFIGYALQQSPPFHTYSMEGNVRWKKFDLRALPNDVFQQCVNKYGMDLVSRTFSKSSEYNQWDAALCEACHELKRLHKEKWKGRKLQEGVDKIKNCIENGANVNLEVDDNQYTPLHHVRFCSNNGAEVMVGLAQYLMSKGANPLLGPEKKMKSAEKTDYINMTPFNFFCSGTRYAAK